MTKQMLRYNDPHESFHELSAPIVATRANKFTVHWPVIQSQRTQIIRFGFTFCAHIKLVEIDMGEKAKVFQYCLGNASCLCNTELDLSLLLVCQMTSNIIKNKVGEVALTGPAWNSWLDIILSGKNGVTLAWPFGGWMEREGEWGRGGWYLDGNESVCDKIEWSSKPVSKRFKVIAWCDS